MAETVVIADEQPANTGYRFSWSLAFAGGVAATAVTFFLLTLGAGFGLLLVNPVAHTSPSLPTFLTGGAIYFFAAQAFGFAVGGHLAGRLLGPIVESDIQEEFRAAAHGFVAWAVTVLATVTVVAIAGATAIGSGATTAALYGIASSQTGDFKTTASSAASYWVDVLFRPANNATAAWIAPPTAPRSADRAADNAIALPPQTILIDQQTTAPDSGNPPASSSPAPLSNPNADDQSSGVSSAPASQPAQTNGVAPYSDTQSPTPQQQQPSDSGATVSPTVRRLPLRHPIRAARRGEFSRPASCGAKTWLRTITTGSSRL